MSTPEFPQREPGDIPAFNFDETLTYSGSEVLDDRNQHVGKVVDVVYDSRDGDLSSTPTWLVVDPGVLRSAHYVPAAGADRTADGALVVPWDKEWIKSAVKAHRDHVLTDEDRRQLRSHYATPL